MNVTIKGEPTTIEAYMIGSMTLCPPNHIKIARITFNCETIEDADGTIYRKERKGKWIYEGIRGRFPACRCSVCGSIENADWAVIQDGANFCPHCGADMIKETEDDND